MNFRAIVPDKCNEGESLRIQISDGTNARVAIPNGLEGGDSFVFRIPTDQLKDSKLLLEELEKQATQNSKKQQKKQTNKHQQSIPTAQVETRPNSDDFTKLVMASPVALADTNKERKQRLFHDREINNWQDFGLALTVGLLVGSAIVFGFLLGILHATEAIYTLHPIEKPKQPVNQQRQPQSGGAKLPKSGPSATA